MNLKRNNMKQTAVEWLVEGILNYQIKEGVIPQNIIEQAKEMEKQQDKNKYSVEEVETIAKDAHAMGRNNILIGVFNKWFEQFKKK
jgi:hypothetical protein